MIRSEFDPEFLILDNNDISWCTADVLQAFRYVILCHVISFFR